MKPLFLYGTAWKEDDTERCVLDAIDAGFRGIDTANQRKHYFELAVGNAVKKTLSTGKLSREDLFLQTKFTSLGGQDDRLPYDPHSDLGKSLRHQFDIGKALQVTIVRAPVEKDHAFVPQAAFSNFHVRV